MTSLPSSGAAAIIFDTQGRVLLVKENYISPGSVAPRWSLPGGAVEPGETPQEAAIRETLEETGLTVNIDHLIGSYTLDTGFTAYAFRCHILAGTPSVPATGEIAEIRWSPPGDLPSPMSNLLHYAMPDAMLGLSNVVRMGLPVIS